MLHRVRDRLPLDLVSHLGAELPLLIRGVYYDQFEPSKQPTDWDREAFLKELSRWLSDVRRVDAEEATRAVFAVLWRYISDGQMHKVQQALPEDLHAICDPESAPA